MRESFDERATDRQMDADLARRRDESGHGDDRHYTDPPKWLGGGLTYDERTGMSVIADGVPQVLAAAREQMGRGAAMIKVMASGGAASEFDPLEITEYTLEELRAAVDVASSFGT